MLNMYVYVDIYLSLMSYISRQQYKSINYQRALTLAALFWPQHQGKSDFQPCCESSDTEEHFLLLVCEYDTGECAWLLRARRNQNQGACFWSFKRQTQTIIEDEKLWNSLGHRSGWANSCARSVKRACGLSSPGAKSCKPGRTFMKVSFFEALVR